MWFVKALFTLLSDKFLPIPTWWLWIWRIVILERTILSQSPGLVRPRVRWESQVLALQICDLICVQLHPLLLKDYFFFFCLLPSRNLKHSLGSTLGLLFSLTHRSWIMQCTPWHFSSSLRRLQGNVPQVPSNRKAYQTDGYISIYKSIDPILTLGHSQI